MVTPAFFEKNLVLTTVTVSKRTKLYNLLCGYICIYTKQRQTLVVANVFKCKNSLKQRRLGWFKLT